MNCHVCNSKTFAIQDFGQMPIANNFVKNKSQDVYRFHLSTSFCENCLVFQIDNQPKPELMFHNSYPFFTGLSKYMKKHFKEMVELHLSESEKKNSELFVVEIGSNDGTLLKNVKDKGIRHLGIDPSANVVKIAKDLGVNSEVAFFSHEIGLSVAEKYQRADFIFAANVVCHIKDLRDFGMGISSLLSDDGKFIFEEPYIGSMLEKTSYDQIYDEHVYIFGLLSISKIFGEFGLELIDAIPQITHGGSMRYVLMKKGADKQTNRVKDLLEKEKFANYHNLSPYIDFAKQCVYRKIELLKLLEKLKIKNYRVAGYAATSKSTTVLNFCGIDSSLIEYICDSTPEKQNKITPGSHIPIISIEEMKKNTPDYFVLFAWNHEHEILEKEIELTKNGVKWIRFVPQVELIPNHE